MNFVAGSPFLAAAADGMLIDSLGGTVDVHS